MPSQAKHFQWITMAKTKGKEEKVWLMEKIEHVATFGACGHCLVMPSRF
jgi:hypothetical protein